MHIVKINLDALQGGAEVAIFDFFCDWALVEELKHRCGDDAVRAALGVAPDTIYSWRTRGRKRLSQKQRDGLLLALEGTKTPQELDFLASAERLRRIEEKLDRLPSGQPTSRAARPTRPAGGAKEAGVK